MAMMDWTILKRLISHLLEEIINTDLTSGEEVLSFELRRYNLIGHLSTGKSRITTKQDDDSIRKQDSMRKSLTT